MKASFHKVMVSEVYVAEESGTQYGTFISEDGTFKIAACKGTFDIEALPCLEAMKMQCSLKGRLFQGGQSLEVVDMSVQLLNAKKTA